MPAASGRLLKIHSAEDVMPGRIPHVTLLYPFWGLPTSEPSPDIYARFIQTGSDHFRLVSADEADFFVLPFDWRYATPTAAPTNEDMVRARANAQRFADHAATLGKRLIVFYIGDTEEELPLPNAVVFRTSLKRGLRPNEFAMSVFFEDVVGQKLGTSLPLRPKLRLPSVGFCGFAGYRLLPDVSFPRKLRRGVRWIRDGLPAPTVREQAIRLLRQHPSVVTDFILVEHGLGREGYGRSARDAFYRNLVNTDYTLCSRGLGNWSIRFYEALACARIPLFIDTECGLPYDFEIDYRGYCAWVDSGQVEDAGERLVAFHDRLDDAEFVDLQRACRRIWQQRLSPEG
ncbi:MAG: hypothetical protein ACXWDK_10915, partial [Aeromicrobium sp.]